MPSGELPRVRRRFAVLCSIAVAAMAAAGWGT